MFLEKKKKTSYKFWIIKQFVTDHNASCYRYGDKDSHLSNIFEYICEFLKIKSLNLNFVLLQQKILPITDRILNPS